MKKVRLGIIGMGNMGTGHLDHTLTGRTPEIEVTAVADTNPARLEATRALLNKRRADYPDLHQPDIALFGTAEEMLNSGLIDAVEIAVPHYDHPRYAIEAMRAGIHVMCEKPAGVYTLQVREMMEEADRHPDIVFGMMFNQRTNHVYRKMKEIMDSGALGPIRRTSWIITNWYRNQAYYDSGAWRATWSGEGGGVLLNQCPHNLDLWQWICGMPRLVDVRMHFGKWHDIEVEDTLHAMLMYENGALGSVIATTSVYPGFARRLTVCGEEGTIELEEDRIAVWKLKGGSMPPELAGADISGSSDPASIGMQGHVRQLENFAAAIRGEEPLLVDAAEGCKPLAVIWGIYEASEKGRVITI